MRARLGAPKAITATAHKLARLVYSMLRYGTAYVDAGQQAYEQKYRDRVLTNLQRKAKAFGYQLVHVEDLDSGSRRRRSDLGKLLGSFRYRRNARRLINVYAINFIP